MRSRLIFLGVVFLVFITLLSCSRKRMLYFNVQCFIINLKESEILVKTENGEGAVIGFFLQPKQQYKYVYDDSLVVEYSKAFVLTFDFYDAGKDSNFTHLVGEHTLRPAISDVGDNVICTDTAYVY